MELKFVDEVDSKTAELVARIEELKARREELEAAQRLLDSEIVAYLAKTPAKKPGDDAFRREKSRLARETLKLSPAVARSRVSAALVARSCPQVIEHIRAGRMKFSALRALEPHRNIKGLADRCVNLNRREVEKLINQRLEQAESDRTAFVVPRRLVEWARRRRGFARSGPR